LDLVTVKTFLDRVCSKWDIVAVHHLRNSDKRIRSAAVLLIFPDVSNAGLTSFDFLPAFLSSAPAAAPGLPWAVHLAGTLPSGPVRV
jgi:hypothetical protein